MPVKRPWHRQEDESEYAYKLFEAYLALKGTRSIRKAVAAYSEKSPVPASNTNAGIISKNHNWKARALAFDHHKQEKQDEAIRQRLHREQAVLAKKRIKGREIVLEEAIRHLEAIQNRNLAGLEAGELQKHVAILRQTFELIGLGTLDSEHQLRSLPQKASGRIRSVKTSQDPERLLGLQDQSNAVQSGSIESEAVLDEADRDLQGSSGPENKNDSGSSG
jgi:hypothetical protein